MTFAEYIDTITVQDEELAEEIKLDHAQGDADDAEKAEIEDMEEFDNDEDY